MRHLKHHFRGKESVIELAVSSFLAGGHLLLEGPPGTGKTSLAKAMASAFGGSFRRVQMTSDLLPSDIIGTLRYYRSADRQEFEFRQGPLFSNILLADELNRTSPKTQSALLEAMAEGTVTVDGKTYPLPDPFFVVATQNPLEFHGVYPLAESQLDRFMIQLLVASPDRESELEIYRASITAHESKSAPSDAVLSLDQTLVLRGEVSGVHVEDSVLGYVSELVRKTRDRNDALYGVSVRGGLQLLMAARALAYIRGRKYVLPKDVKDLAIPVLSHRLCFGNGEPDIRQKHELIQDILERVPAPK